MYKNVIRCKPNVFNYWMTMSDNIFLSSQYEILWKTLNSVKGNRYNIQICTSKIQIFICNIQH